MAELINGKIKLENGKMVTPKEGEWYDGQHLIGGKLGAKGVVNDPNAVGYGQRVSQDVNLQSDRAAGLDPGTIERYLGTGALPKFNDAKSAADFANATQDNFTGVKSRAEIRSDIESELNLPERPTTPSLLETFKTQKTEAGLDTLQEEINTLTAEERELVAIDRQRKATERSKPETLGVIAGRVSEIERQSSERLDVIQRQKAYKVDQYNSALTSIQMLMQFTQQDYENATNSFNSQFTQGLQMIDAISGIEKSQKDDAQRARDNANATLGVMMNAITSGNMSYESLDTNQKFNISKLEAQAGLPVGFISNLKISPSDRILNINSETGEALVVDANGNMKVEKTGMTLTPKKTGSAEQLSEDAKDFNRTLDEVVGADGYVSGEDYKAAKRQWMALGNDASEFDKRFKTTYVNPKNAPEYYGFPSNDEYFSS